MWANNRKLFYRFVMDVSSSSTQNDENKNTESSGRQQRYKNAIDELYQTGTTYS